MKKSVLLAVGLALSLGGLALVWSARVGKADAAGPGEKRKEGARDKGETAPKAAASRITRVTVYPDSALVTREVEVPEGKGLFELVVTPLPQQTANSSLYSEGGDGIRVLSTRFRSRPVREDTRDEVRRLEDEIKKLQNNAQKIQADVTACQQNTAFLAKLENFVSASTTSATEKGKLDSEATIALSKYVTEGRAERAKEMVTLQQQLQDNAEQLEFARRKLNEKTAGTTRTEHDAVITVDKVNAATGKVRLNYLVSAASWRPQYKFRSGRTAKDAVTVEYLAAVVQQTGEDWANVEVVLSTAQPMLNAAPPELRTLAVAVVPRGTPMPGVPVTGAQLGVQFGTAGRPGTVPPGPGMGAGGMRPPAFANPEKTITVDELNKAIRSLRVQAQQVANEKKEAAATEVTNYAAALEQARDLVMQTEGKRRLAGDVTARSGRNEGPSVTYHLPGKLTVPSRADDQVIEVTKLEMEPEYFYKAVPVLSPHVYRQANLTNGSKYILLPGEATMYAGADFVGRMNLPLVAIGEQFTVGFGTEPQLQVTRHMLDKSRALQGGNQVLKYEYRLLVSSYKREKVKVQVWDRLPHAETESMNVTLVKAAPEVSKDPVYEREERPSNLLRWDVEVGPEMRAEKALKIRYEFKLELDKQATLGSFQSK